MPVPVSYPGVYVEELPSAVRTITGVPTSITAFVGRAWRGPVDEPVKISSYSDYERQFGGLWRDSTMSYAVQQFFSNGGSQADHRPRGDAQRRQRRRRGDVLVHGRQVQGREPGQLGHEPEGHGRGQEQDEGSRRQRAVQPEGVRRSRHQGRRGEARRQRSARVLPERLGRSGSPRFVTKVLAQQSQLLRVDSGLGTTTAPGAATNGADATSGTDGTAVGATEVTDASNDGAAKTGMYALRKTDIFNLLCIPPYTPTTTTMAWPAGPPRRTLQGAPRVPDRRWTRELEGRGRGGARRRLQRDRALLRRRLLPAAAHPRSAAGRQPRRLPALRRPSPASCARTDAQRGVWKAPAGIEATLAGVAGLDVHADRRARTAMLNPLGVNCLRTLPGLSAAWSGARARCAAPTSSPTSGSTSRSAALALFIEESLFRGTQWVVFEPNDEPLWAQIRLNVGAFMQNLFRQGAFQGTTPREAYFVKCDSETTTQNDIDLGIVNIVVGFAPLKPAEFVVIQIQQMAGQIADLEESRPWRSSPSTRTRFDPYKNFKFRVKWDGRYVAGVSKVSALKRTTEVVEAPRGRRPSTSAQVAGAHRVRGDHARARRHARHRVRAVGEQGLELRRRPRRGGLAQGLPQGHHHRGLQRGRPAGDRLQGLSAAGSRSTRRCPISTPTPTRSRSSTSSSRTRAGSATTT